MQTPFTKTTRGSQRRAARLATVALVAALLSLSLAGIAAPRAHAATRQATDGVHACDETEELDLFDVSGNVTCYSGTGYLLGITPLPNVVSATYYGTSDNGWLRVYDAHGGYWQNMRMPYLRTGPLSITFGLPVLVTQICLNCGLYPISGVQRIDCNDAQLELDITNTFGICFAGTGYVGLGAPGQDGDVNHAIDYYYPGLDDSWLLVYDFAGGYYLNVGPKADDFSGTLNDALVTQICLHCGYHL